MSGLLTVLLYLFAFQEVMFNFFSMFYLLLGCRTLCTLAGEEALYNYGFYCLGLLM